MRLLEGGNYTVASSRWDNGLATDAGALTFGHGDVGVVGVVSAANSLVGSSANDLVGLENLLAHFGNGNYLFLNPSWDNGSATDAGAVTFIDGQVGVTGVVSASNSLVGTSANDRVGLSRLEVLPNGNFVLESRNWDNGSEVDAGAVTFVNGTTGITGEVSAMNSLVGSFNGRSGWVSVRVLSDGNYVVVSTSWDNGEIADAGAVTFGDGTVGVVGVVSASNSLVGSFADSRVGAGVTNGSKEATML